MYLGVWDSARRYLYTSGGTSYRISPLDSADKCQCQWACHGGFSLSVPVGASASAARPASELGFKLPVEARGLGRCTTSRTYHSNLKCILVHMPVQWACPSPSLEPQVSLPSGRAATVSESLTPGCCSRWPGCCQWPRRRVLGSSWWQRHVQVDACSGDSESEPSVLEVNLSVTVTHHPIT
jgi:hypothetical protein